MEKEQEPWLGGGGGAGRKAQAQSPAATPVEITSQQARGQDSPWVLGKQG